eukprot:4806543-Amphidinium_carterae.1
MLLLFVCVCVNLSVSSFLLRNLEVTIVRASTGAGLAFLVASGSVGSYPVEISRFLRQNKACPDMRPTVPPSGFT